MGGLIDLSQNMPEWVALAALVFARVGAVISVAPAFGAPILPRRIRLGAAIAFTMIVLPAVSSTITVPETTSTLAAALMIESVIGLAMGLSLRMILMALQIAGNIAAQSASLAQVLGPSALPDPMPAIGTILVMGAFALAFAAGLHVKLAVGLIRSYDLVSFNTLPESGEVAEWARRASAESIRIGFALSSPFLLAALAYNLALGAINKAMPQLMVVFIGAPAITAAGLILMLLAAPLILTLWVGYLDRAILAPFVVRP